MNRLGTPGGGAAGTAGSTPQREASGTVAVFALTTGGARVARRVAEAIGGELWLPESMADVDSRVLEAGGTGGRPPDPHVGVRRFDRVGPALRAAFEDGVALICVMASGVVVRSLAPALRTKYVDPAVLVMDEAGRFVVPLLSGHLGGANALALEVARALGAEAVLTTSSDVQGRVGPDVLAASLDAHVVDPRRLLPVASALANGETVDVWLDAGEVGPSVVAGIGGLAGYRQRWLGDVPPEGIAGPAVLLSSRVAAAPTSGPGASAPAADVFGEDGVSAPAAATDDTVLWLVPRGVVAGVGCRRGTPKDALLAAVGEALRAAALHPKALRALATAEAKRDEAGVVDASAALGVPLLVAADGEIQATMAAHGLAENPWVRDNVGVGGVSEPAALWAAGPGAHLILPKQAAAGVTVALAGVAADSRGPGVAIAVPGDARSDTSGGPATNAGAGGAMR